MLESFFFFVPINGTIFFFADLFLYFAPARARARAQGSDWLVTGSVPLLAVPPLFCVFDWLL
jgi:hypothetical protein